MARSLEKLVDDPDKSKVRLGEYAGEESDDADKLSSLDCVWCFHGGEEPGDNVEGGTCFTV